MLTTPMVYPTAAYMIDCTLIDNGNCADFACVWFPSPVVMPETDDLEALMEQFGIEATVMYADTTHNGVDGVLLTVYIDIEDTAKPGSAQYNALNAALNAGTEVFLRMNGYVQSAYDVVNAQRGTDIVPVVVHHYTN